MFWDYFEARESYQKALAIIKARENPELFFDILQKLITLNYLLNEIEAYEYSLKDGILAYENHLLSLPDSKREFFALKFPQFFQLKVEVLLEKNEFIRAIEIAEERKNYSLFYEHKIAYKEDFKPSSFKDLQNEVCNKSTAVIYWHLSPVSIATFIIFYNENPILVPPPHLGASQTSPDTLFLSRVQQHKFIIEIIQKYNGLYKPEKLELFSSWRSELEQCMVNLYQLLNIEFIETKLISQQIKTLILIPHRDLHRLPLNSLFSCPCYCIPSMAFVSRKYDYSGLFNIDLNLIENPDSKPLINDEFKQLSPLPFAEVEAALLRYYFPNNNTLSRKDTGKEKVTQLIQKGAKILHFAGHATYNDKNPKKSCLYLSKNDRLTVEDIMKQDLSCYELVSLSACETAVTGNETLIDEYVGIVSAFLRAGAKYVLSTLWSVESLPTTLFIVEFYKRILENQLPHRALKNTQIWLQNLNNTKLLNWMEEHCQHLPDSALKAIFDDQISDLKSDPGVRCRYGEPYYWAAFTISGYLGSAHKN